MMPFAVLPSSINFVRRGCEAFFDRSNETNHCLPRLDPASGNCVQCILEWDSEEAFTKALGEDEAKIMGDIPNYTAGKPTIIVGKVVGGS
jgi:hypothetical protein